MPNRQPPLPPIQTRTPMSVPLRPPTWVSPRRILEQKLQDLYKSTNLSHIKQLHAQIIRHNLHEDLYVAPKLISAFALCRQISMAANVFNQIGCPNVHLYNALIRAHTHNSQPAHAFAAFSEMQRRGVFGDNFTYSFILKACSRLRTVQMVHAHIEKARFWCDVFVPNSLIDSYSKCGEFGLHAARKLFMVMDYRDTVSWNSIIGGLLKAGLLNEARELFDEMPERDIVSWNTMLDGYVKSGEMDKAFELFEAMPERNVVSWSTMVLGYSKSGDMEMAGILFDKMPFKSLVSWTIIISGYAEKGFVKEAMALYDQLEREGLKLDDGSVISILSACSQSGLLGLGMRVHASIQKTRFRCSIAVSNALVDMFAKCGNLDKAFHIFNGMSKKDVVSWNCMLQGLAMHGKGKEALELFTAMKQEGFRPDKVTFVGVLCACTHAGFFDEGISHFYAMERDYGIVPHVEHYGCMIDLLGRGGRLKEALSLIRTMPYEPNAIIWGTLLNSCRMHSAAEIAEEVLDQLIKLDPSDPGNYSMLSNIFAAAGDWDSVASVRVKMKCSGVQKPSGASVIEVDNEVHEFTVFDKSHPEANKIYQMIEKMRQDLKQLLHPESMSTEVAEMVNQANANPAACDCY